MKKIIIIALVVIIIICCSSCTYSQNITYIPKNNQVEHHLIYQGNEYYLEAIFTANNDGKSNQDDIKIGMYYSFPFGTDYYSYTDESPDYIYSVKSGKGVYLKKGFNYNLEVFVVDKTHETFVFSEELTETKFEMSYMYNDVVLRSEKYPSLKINAQLFFDNVNWYLIFQTNKAYLISSSLLEILRRN